MLGLGQHLVHLHAEVAHERDEPLVDLVGVDAVGLEVAVGYDLGEGLDGLADDLGLGKVLLRPICTTEVKKKVAFPLSNLGNEEILDFSSCISTRRQKTSDCRLKGRIGEQAWLNENW